MQHKLLLWLDLITTNHVWPELNVLSTISHIVETRINYQTRQQVIDEVSVLGFPVDCWSMSNTQCAMGTMDKDILQKLRLGGKSEQRYNKYERFSLFSISFLCALISINARTRIFGRIFILAVTAYAAQRTVRTAG